jgi:hypothetical protein
MAINWKKAEDTLVRLATAEVQRIARHPVGEPFYGFAFDCNSDYGEVLISLNVPSALEQSARTFAAKYPEMDEAGWRDKLRWALGDWKFPGIESEDFRTAWEPIADK